MSERRCIERRAHTATVSLDLPYVVDSLRVERIRVRRRTATAYVCNWALCRQQLLRKQPTGSWRIESFQLPVND